MEDPANIPSFRSFLEQDVEEKRRVLASKVQTADALAAQIPSFSQFKQEPTAAHEAVMSETGVDHATADKFLKSPAAKNVGHLPPTVPTRSNSLIDQRAAQFEVMKAGGNLEKLTPQQRAEFTAPLQSAGWEVGPDYIKPPSAEPGAWPLWEHQLAGQGGGPVERDTRAPITRMFARGGQMVTDAAVPTLKSAGKVAGAALTGQAVPAMKELDKAIVQPQLDQMNQAYALYKERGKVDPEIAAHALAYAIPFLGPVAAGFGEKTGKGVGKLSEGDAKGWEDLISAVPEGAMLIAPLLPKVFAAVERGVPIEEAAATIAPEARSLIGAKLKEPVTVEGTAATGAKPKIVLPRKEVPSAETIRENQGVVPEVRQAGEGSQGASSADVHQGRQGGQPVQPGEVAPPRQEGKITPQEVAANANQEPIPINTGREGAAGAETQGQVTETSAPTEAPAKAAAKEVGERSLPRTLEGAGLAKGTDLTYDVANNPSTVEAAQRNVTEKGIEGATEYVKSAESPTAEHVATGFAVIRELQNAGDFTKAAEVASDLSAKLTTSGQAIQAVKTVMEFAPERAVVTAQKILDQSGKGKKLAPIQAERITKAATAIEDTGKTVAKTETRLDELSAKLPETSPANWRAKLTAAEDAARARLKERQGVKLGSEAGEAPIIADIADLAIVGAAKLARKGIDFATWSKEMVGEFGDTIKPHLATIYRKSFEAYSGAKKEAYQAMKERSVQKGLPAMTAQELATAVQQRDLAIKARTAATRGLAREYESLQPGSRFKREALSILNLPRALKASFDLSAPLRQGAVFLPEVKASAKAFGAQIRALSERGFEKAYTDIQSNPEYKTAQASGLEFTGTPLRSANKLNAAEEAFMTRWAEKIPGVKQSEQAYTTYLDTLRMNVFEKYSKQIKETITDPKVQQAELKHWASFVNKATGRGDLGRAGNAIAPVLNSVFFAPRYAVSRLQILNPATYMKMTPFARKVALRKMFQFTGMVGTTLALAKAGGLEVSTDPQSADFLKIKSGDTRFDILAGTQQWMRFAARMSAGFYKSSQGEKMKQGEQPLEVLTRFARSKASPPAGVVWDYATGRTFEGEQPTLKGELQDQFIPLFLKDSYDTWKNTNTPTGTKAAAVPAGFFGVGVQTYQKKSSATQQKELRKMMGLE